MSKLTIKRNSEWNNRARNFKIYIDGEKIDVIGNNEIKDFKLKSGNHMLVLKIDWCRSRTFEFDIKENDNKIVSVSGFKYGGILMPLAFLLLLFYNIGEILFETDFTFLLAFPILCFAYVLFFITFGKNRYLRLVEEI